MESAFAGHLRPRQWQDWGNLALGIWVFITPWVLAMFGTEGTSPVFWILGVIVVISSACAVYRGSFQEAQWVNLLAGFSLFLESLTGQMTPAFMWNSLVTGIIISVLAIWTLLDYRRQPASRI